MSFTTASELSRRWGILPRVIPDLFYARVLDDSRCPMVGRSRAIPSDYVPEIEAILRERGVLVEAGAVA